MGSPGGSHEHASRHSGHDLYWHYCNPGHPFGHEMVLHALLVLDDPADYPWNRYRREHPAPYENVAHVAV